MFPSMRSNVQRQQQAWVNLNVLLCYLCLVYQPLNLMVVSASHTTTRRSHFRSRALRANGNAPDIIPALAYVGEPPIRHNDTTVTLTYGACQGRCTQHNHCQTGLFCVQRYPNDNIVSTCVPPDTGTYNDTVINTLRLMNYCAPPPPDDELVTLVEGNTTSYDTNNVTLTTGLACHGGCTSDTDCHDTLVCSTPEQTKIPGCVGTKHPQVNYCYSPDVNPTTTTTGATTTLAPTAAPVATTPTTNDDVTPKLEYVGEPPFTSVLLECQGDCDSDWHCDFGLNCFKRSDASPIPGCQSSTPENDPHDIYSVDYCYRPPPGNLVIVQNVTASPPSTTTAAESCQGNCHVDTDCQTGLQCFIRDNYEMVPGCKGLGAFATNYCYNASLANDDDDTFNQTGTTPPTALVTPAPTMTSGVIVVPTVTPSTIAPSVSPSERPSTDTPSVSPSGRPSTNTPSMTPSTEPSAIRSPSENPTVTISEPPSVLPTFAPSENPTVTVSDAPSVSPTLAPSENPTVTVSDTPSALPTFAPSENPTVTVSHTPSALPTSSPTQIIVENVDRGLPTIVPTTADGKGTTPIITVSSRPTLVPSMAPSLVAPSENPTVTLSESPSGNPSFSPSLVAPSENPTVTLSEAPSVNPTFSPSLVAPSENPTVTLSASPSGIPSFSPTWAPSENPTVTLSESPSGIPSSSPSWAPSENPTVTLSASPSGVPSFSPSWAPTENPTVTLSESPSGIPSSSPSLAPSENPSVTLSESPSGVPSSSPSLAPSENPTVTLSESPSGVPSFSPSLAPSESPTVVASETPSSTPSTVPTQFVDGDGDRDLPTIVPTTMDGKGTTPTTVSPISSKPTLVPSTYPSSDPAGSPSGAPTDGPSLTPSGAPSRTPSAVPLSTPSTESSFAPSSYPSSVPIDAPSFEPSNLPSFGPSSEPSLAPSTHPLTSPSDVPSTAPTTYPSSFPIVSPSSSPTLVPITSLPTIKTPITGDVTCDDLSIETRVDMILERLINFFNYTNNELDVTNSASKSPQRWAFEWIVYDDEACPDSTNLVQRFVLAVFWFTSGGNKWPYFWNETYLASHDSECEWYGIECADNETVTGLHFDNSNITGTLPWELSKLTEVTELNIDSNQLVGSIPSWLDQWTRLEIVDMDHNLLTGSIPSSLFSISTLRVLDLDSNALTGTISESGLANWVETLYFLQLDFNQLVGTIPSMLGQMKVLQYLSIFGNNFTETLLSTIENLCDDTRTIYANCNLCQNGTCCAACLDI